MSAVRVRPSSALPRHGGLTGGGPRTLGLIACALGLAATALASVAVGARSIPLGDVVDALFDYDPTVNAHLIVNDLRLPRTEVGLLVGVALGLAGAVMQGVTRNPVADPGLLGVNAGAAVMVVVGIYVFGVGTLYGYVWFAFGGAAAAGAAVYAIGSLGREGATPVKLALSGAALSAFLVSVTIAILLLDKETLNQYRYWEVGSLAGRGEDIAAHLAPFIAGGVLLALACGPSLNALALGDDVARGLGQRVGRARALAGLSVIVLCGAATAAAGPIWFVGLIVPHMARAICGPDYRWILAYSMLLAPMLLLGSDVIGRVVVRPSELQVGIVTAAIGAPFFVWLVRRRDFAAL